jgi:hypothetical protein
MDLNNATRFSDNREVESAYVITLRGHELSERLARRCIQSCRDVQMPVKVWEAFDGTGSDLKIPNLLKNKEYTYWLKWINNTMNLPRIACVYSHFSLWCHCMTIDKPIVILEHDAVMLKPYLFHTFYNCIEYLGCQQQVEAGGFTGQLAYSYVLDKNYYFMSMCHAYAVDPAVCHKLVGYFIKNGITDSLDVMLRMDLFPVMQRDLYAYQKPDKSTIEV